MAATRIVPCHQQDNVLGRFHQENQIDCVPSVIWWAFEEWLVRLIQSMYENARSRVRVGCSLSDKFSVNVGVHQGSCLSQLLFTMIREALSQEFRTWCPWENMHAGDLVTIFELLEEFQEKLRLWKSIMEDLGQHGQNQGFDIWAGTQYASEVQQIPLFRVSQTQGCRHKLHFWGSCCRWVQKSCNGISVILKPDPNFRCERCSGVTRLVDGSETVQVTWQKSQWERRSSRCYSRDNLSSGGGCELSAFKRWRVANNELLLPITTTAPATGRLKKPGQNIRLNRLALDLRPTLPTGKPWVVHLDVPSDWTNPKIEW